VVRWLGGHTRAPLVTRLFLARWSLFFALAFRAMFFRALVSRALVLSIARLSVQ
jgi:hypothetical protein